MDKLLKKNRDSKNIKGNFPPKKGTFRKVRNNSFDKDIKKSDGIKLIDIVKKSKNKKTKNVANFNDKESVHSGHVRRRRSLVDYINENQKTNKDGIDIYLPAKNEKTVEKLKPQEKTVDKLNEEPKKNLDNFELNNLDYEKAYELDKRSCCKTYFSVILNVLLLEEDWFAHSLIVGHVPSAFCFCLYFVSFVIFLLTLRGIPNSSRIRGNSVLSQLHSINLDFTFIARSKV